MNNQINEKIRALMEERGLKIIDLANRVNEIMPGDKKLHASQLSRMLKGERKWLMSHLVAVAQGLGISLGEIIEEDLVVPIRGKISGEKSPYPIDNSQPPLGFIPCRVRDLITGVGGMDNIYGLIVEDNAFEPTIFKNAKLLVEKEADIHEGDLVVYCDDEKNLIIGRLQFHDKEQFILRSLNPQIQKDLILPTPRLKSLDRIKAQIF
jgi:transcriptional regulator with XRE-family HTH domain